MKVTTMPGQSLQDIAVQEYGDLSAVFILARKNGVSPTEDLRGGQELERPDVTVDREMERYCRTNGVSPATGAQAGGDIVLRIFTGEFTEEFS